MIDHCLRLKHEDQETNQSLHRREKVIDQDLPFIHENIKKGRGRSFY